MAATPILFRSIVPTIDLSENLSPQYIVTQSPQEYRFVQYPATSFSQSYINWNIIPPSPDTIISRYVRINLPLHFTVTGQRKSNVNWNINVINSEYAGLCNYPLHQIINTLTITLNNQALTIKPSQIIDKLFYYTFDREIQKSTMSTTTSFPDMEANYDHLVNAITNPYAGFENSVDHISRTS
ncbi:MAG: hypothetical protein NZZ41_07675, partial [Candidatus Dojkabacteria bacterium]|nr:hypothetical protein [Candidatus Dojkabacteria bacterium]